MTSSSTAITPTDVPVDGFDATVTRWSLADLVRRTDGAQLRDDSRQSRELARDARCLLFFGKQLGAIIGAGDAVFARARSSRHVLLLSMAEDEVRTVLAHGAKPACIDAVVRDIAPELPDLTEAGQPVRRAPPARAPTAPGGPEWTLECDLEGRVRASTLPPSLGPPMVSEAALLVTTAMGELDGAAGPVDLIDFRYREARLVLKRTESGFSLSLCTGSASLSGVAPASERQRPAPPCAVENGREQPPVAASAPFCRVVP